LDLDLNEVIKCFSISYRPELGIMPRMTEEEIIADEEEDQREIDNRMMAFVILSVVGIVGIHVNITLF
jgi:hypothetical protein